MSYFDGVSSCSLSWAFSEAFLKFFPAAFDIFSYPMNGITTHQKTNHHRNHCELLEHVNSFKTRLPVRNCQIVRSYLTAPTCNFVYRSMICLHRMEQKVRHQIRRAERSVFALCWHDVKTKIRNKLCNLYIQSVNLSYFWWCLAGFLVLRINEVYR